LVALSASLSNANAYVRNDQTASMAVLNSKFAETASYVADLSNLNLTDYVRNSRTSSMTVGTASLAITASYALFAQNASNVDTANFIQNFQTASMRVGTASLAIFAFTASYALNAAGSDTSSFLQINTDQTFRASLVVSASLGVSGSVFFGNLPSASYEQVVIWDTVTKKLGYRNIAAAVGSSGTSGLLVQVVQAVLLGLLEHLE
jgi:uncharacterized protein YfiM (DUF2279 family)